MAQLQSTVVSGNTSTTGFISAGGRKLSMGILDLRSDGTPTQFKIKTTIPWNSGGADFTVNIKGFRYGGPQMVSLSIGWHHYLNTFHNEKAISNGAWAPTITLAKSSDNYVVIHLAGPGYWPKLYVESLYSSSYTDSYASGWTWSDADLSDCTDVSVVPYDALACSITGNSVTTSQTNFSTLTLNSATVATQSWVQSQGYITGESDTLASVTGRGATTSTAVTFNGNVNANGTYFNVGGYIDLSGLLYLRSNVNYLNASSNGWNTFLARNGEGFDAYVSRVFSSSHISSTGGNIHTARGRVAFSSTSTDANHTIYNNYNNIDGEGSWDGMKMNVYNGLDVRTGNASGAAPSTVLQVRPGGLIITGTLAWNNATPMVNVGGSGDGRMQVRHIWGKEAGTANPDHLWLQYTNSSFGVQIGASGGTNPLYVAGDIYMNGYFSGSLVATRTWVQSQGYITGYTESDTLATVTGRGATTSSPITISTGGSQPLSLTTSSGSPWHIALNRTDLGLTSRVFAHNSPYNGWYFEHNIIIAGNTNIHSGNYTSYSPSLTGSGASGTWGISITGSAASATNATNLYGAGGSYIQSTSTGTSYTANYQVRENSGGGGSTNEIYAPQLAFHWSGVVASSIMMESSGRIAIRNNPGSAYESFIAYDVYGSNSMRAPQFRFTNSSNNAYLTGNSDWGFRVVNDNGYIQFGPANGSWSHIYSDKSFYFNQELYVNNNQVIHPGNTSGVLGAKYQISDTWLRVNSDNRQFQMYGNSRTMIYRTDGNTNEHGGGGYAHIFYYGGSADGNRRMIINTDGTIWSSNYGWLSDAFASKSTTHVINAQYNATISTDGWYTIASYGSGRALATFHIFDTDSSRHNYAEVKVNWSYGHGGVTVVNNGRHGVSTIKHVRLLYNTSDQTYGGVKIQVYCENSTFVLRIRQEYPNDISGWGSFSQVSPTLENSPAGWAEYTRAHNVNERGVITTSNSTGYLGGNVIWHQGNLTNLNQLTNGPGYITSSALGSYLPLSGGTLSGNLNIQTGNNPAHFLLRGTNSELYVDAGYGGGTARLIINRQGTGNQAALHFTTGATVTPGTAWNSTGAPLWTMGMTNSSQVNDFKIAYGDIYDAASVAVRIDTNKIVYFTNTPYVGGNIMATQSWVQSQGYLTSATVTINSGNGSASWYPIVWHSGNTLYSSSGLAEIYPAGGYARFNYINTSDNDESGITRFVIKNGDNYHRSATVATAASALSGYFIPYGNWSQSTGMNDSKLYFRTNGDNNHYLWNAGDDWEELNAYEGTGFRITSVGGTVGVLYVYGSSNGGYTYSPYSFRAPIFYDSNDTNYYVDPNSNSYLSRLHVADASSGVSMHVGVGSTHGVYTLDNARKYLVVSGDYYPHMALVARYANNTNHGAVFSFVGSEGGAFRQWNLGISNNNPFLFSIGYNRTTDPNPHYGIGDGWSGSDNDHARLSVDRDGNTKIRGMLYVNGTSGGISTGSAVIHAGNIGSQSVSYASSAGNADTVDGYHATFSGNANTIPVRNGSGYLEPNNWIQLNGIYGLYSPTNNAHLRPNDASYGSWLVTGSRNGWQGFEFNSGSAGNVTLMVHTDSNTSGFHNNSYGWQIRWANGTLYIGKNSYGGNEATVIDSSSIGSQSVNYASSSGTASNANALGGLGSGAYLKDDGWNNYPGQDANTQGTMYSDFTYSNNAPWTGELIRFGASGYSLQLNSQYQGSGLSFRSRNGDNGTWNSWSTVIHSNNIGSQKVDGAFKLWATSHPNDYYIVNNWTGSYWQLTSNHGSGVQVAYANDSGYASSAGNSSTVGGVAIGNIVRKDVTGQYLRAYYEYGSYLTSESPIDLVNQGLAGGGLRVDFMHPSYTGSGGWNHVMTWSGYNGYNMYQLGGHYDGGTGTNLWVRSEANHGRTSWTAWRRLLNTSSDPYAANMNQYVRTSDGVTFSGLTINGTTTLNGNVNIDRHIDADTTWGNCGCTSLFLGWSTGKIIIGNNGTGAHDWANDRGANSIVSTVNHFFYNNIYAREDVIAYWSDARLKDNVRPIEGALEKITKIGGYYYTPSKLAVDLNATSDMSERVGVMAQEIEEVLPHVVKPAPFNSDYKTVQYEKLVPLLIEAIKEQQTQIEELKSKLDGLTK